MAEPTHTIKERIDIAIIGAGISSLCLARGLLQHQRISVRIYEARPEIGHDGSGFGIAKNGQKAMSLIDPVLRDCLERAGGVKNEPHVTLMMATGPHAGEKITDIHADPPQITVRRSNLLTELRNSLPNGVIQTGKRLNTIKHRPREQKKVLLTFEGGIDVLADAVIGADGINSIVRQNVLGDDKAITEPKWSPGCNNRIVIPMNEAEEIFGKEYCKQLTQIGYTGHDGFCLTDIEDDGEAMQVIAGFRGDKPVAEVYGKPYVEVKKEFWTKRLEGWGWIGEKISQVIEKQKKVYAASGRYHDPTPTYCNGRLCIVSHIDGRKCSLKAAHLVQDGGAV